MRDTHINRHRHTDTHIDTTLFLPLPGALLTLAVLRGMSLMSATVAVASSSEGCVSAVDAGDAGDAGGAVWWCKR